MDISGRTGDNCESTVLGTDGLGRGIQKYLL